MRVGVNYTDLVTVQGPRTRPGWVLNLVRPAAGMALMRFQNSNNRNLHSPAFLPSRIASAINASSADLVHLHGVGAEFMSVEDIGRIRKPVVWTLHDMWAFCGAEHVAVDEPTARWRHGYRSDNRPAEHRGLDIDRWTWWRKRRAWTRTMHLITPSRWLAACARGSALMGEWPVRVIPNTLDTQRFQPWPRDTARRLFGLPPAEVPLILFGAKGGTQDPNKGWDLLQPALVSIAKSHPGVEAVVFGQSAPAFPPALGMPVHWMGHLTDEATVAMLYSAVDVTVVPSRQENLPQLATEAQCCACPVVAFRTTGCPDAVEHMESGYLATPFDSEDLAAGIRWLLNDRQRRESVGKAGRERALRLWSPQVVLPQILSVYRAAIDSWHGGSGANSPRA